MSKIDQKRGRAGGFFRRRQSSKEETGAMDFRETPLWRILSGRSY